MSREEIRVDGLAEPISHFTGRGEGGRRSSSVPGIVAVDGQLVGGDDVVAQTRQVFENMRAVLEAGGCGFDDVVKVTVFLTDIDDRPLINPVRQEVFGSTRPASTLVEVPRLAVPGREGRDRVRRTGAVSDDTHQRVHHPGRAWPGRRRARSRDGRSRSGISSTPPAYARRTAPGLYAEHVPRAQRDGRPAARSTRARSSSARRTCPEFAWSVPRAERVVRHVPQPDASREDDRWVVVRLGCRPRRGTLRARARDGHGLFDPPAVRRLRGRRAEVAVGADLDARASARWSPPSTPSGRWREASRTSRSCGRC